MKAGWIPGRMDPERKKEIRQSFVAALVMRKRLKEIIERKMKGSWDASMGGEGFETPNWALKQAYARGYEQALKELSSYLDD